MGDIDILSLHNEILTEFEERKKNIDNIINKYNNLKKYLKNNNYTYRVKNILEKNCENIKNSIDDITQGKSYNFYIMESYEIIKKYRNIILKPLKVSFTGKTKNNNQEKEQLIIKYMEIIKKYKNINITFQKEKDKNISVCQNCNNQDNLSLIDNYYICLECGYTKENLNHHSSYKDAERVNIASKYTYDRKIHFRDCINQYQGKQNSTIDPKVYDNLIKQFDLHGLLVGDKNTDVKIRFQNITKEHIYLFLKENNDTKHYEDAVLIYSTLTKKKTPDISHLENKLMDDFDTLTNLYDKVYKKKLKIDRKNFINTQYVLYQLLNKYKYPCKKEDFNILKTIDRKSFHDEICKELFLQLGWNFVAIF